MKLAILLVGSVSSAMAQETKQGTTILSSIQKVIAIGQEGQLCSAEQNRLEARLAEEQRTFSDESFKSGKLSADLHERASRLTAAGMTKKKVLETLADSIKEEDAIDVRKAASQKKIEEHEKAVAVKKACVTKSQSLLEEYITSTASK